MRVMIVVLLGAVFGAAIIVALEAPLSFARNAAPPQGAASRGFHVNSARLQASLEKLSEFGRNADGGVTRLGYSETEMAAQKYVMGLMRDAGLTVRMDAAGNIFGRRAGSEDLPSGAGHDAQEMAPIAPFGMIFVPSRGGISHSPKEFTSWMDVANGAEVLYRAILIVDGERDRK